MSFFRQDKEASNMLPLLLGNVRRAVIDVFVEAMTQNTHAAFRTWHDGHEA